MKVTPHLFFIWRILALKTRELDHKWQNLRFDLQLTYNLIGTLFDLKSWKVIAMTHIYFLFWALCRWKQTNSVLNEVRDFDLHLTSDLTDTLFDLKSFKVMEVTPFYFLFNAFWHWKRENWIINDKVREFDLYLTSDLIGTLFDLQT